VRQQLKEIDLSGENGVSLYLEFVDVVKQTQLDSRVNLSPWYMVIKEPYEDTIFYERKVNTSKVQVNLPKHGKKVHLIVLGPATLDRILITKLNKIRIPHAKKPSALRPYKLKDIVLVPNNDLDSPARIFTKYPVIEFNPKIFNKFSEPTRAFILLHEMAHYYFDKEEEADRWATIEFLNMGYNLSSANYALTHVLHKQPENVKRMITQDKFLNDINNLVYK